MTNDYLLLIVQLSAVYLRTYLPTYLPTPWNRVLEKLTGSRPIKLFPAFYGTRRFITAFTSARHLYLSSASRFSPEDSITLHVLYFHLRLGPHVVSFPQVFPPIPCIHLSSSPYALHAPPISFSVLSPQQCWVRSTTLLVTQVNCDVVC